MSGGKSPEAGTEFIFIFVKIFMIIVEIGIAGPTAKERWRWPVAGGRMPGRISMSFNRQRVNAQARARGIFEHGGERR